MALKLPTLTKMELEMYLKIITGEQTPDAFDSFVSSWKKNRRRYDYKGSQRSTHLQMMLKEMILDEK